MKRLWSKWKRKAAFVMACCIIFGEIAGLPMLDLSAARQEAVLESEVAQESESTVVSISEPNEEEKIAEPEIIEESESTIEPEPELIEKAESTAETVSEPNN